MAQKKQKALIWFDSFDKWGPLSVVDRLVGSLQKQGFDVRVVTSESSLRNQNTSESTWSFSFKNPDQVVKTPYLTLMDYGPDYGADGLGKIMQKEFDDFKPDVVITEQYPFLAFDEGMNDFLARVKQQHPQTKIIGLGRDVPEPMGEHPDHASDFETDESHYSAMIKNAEPFDYLAIRGDQGLIDYQRFFTDDQWSQIKDRIHYAGYMIPKNSSVRATGGGAWVSFGATLHQREIKRVKALLNVFPELNKPLQEMDWHIVSEDPDEMELRVKDELEKLPEELREHIKFESRQVGFSKNLKSADMVLCHGGLTSVEAAAYCKPTVIITDDDPMISEQTIRGAALAEHPKLDKRIRRVVQQHYTHEIDTEAFKDALNGAYAGRTKKVNPIRIDGHKNMAAAAADASMGVTPNFEGRNL